MGLRLPENIEALEANATKHVASKGYDYPDLIDWRWWGGVQDVKNQGGCGSCYAFSAMGALETACWRKTNYLPDLSEQHCVDCSRYQGCDGGWMHEVYAWVGNNNGVASQGDYPYKGYVGTCYNNCRKSAYIGSYTRIYNEADLFDAVATVGTVAVAYNADHPKHSAYKDGVLDLPDCGTDPTHAVLLIGYGTDGGIPYWLLKNSWGKGWGKDGTFKLRHTAFAARARSRSISKLGTEGVSDVNRRFAVWHGTWRLGEGVIFTNVKELNWSTTANLSGHQDAGTTSINSEEEWSITEEGDIKVTIGSEVHNIFEFDESVPKGECARLEAAAGLVLP